MLNEDRRLRSVSLADLLPRPRNGTQLKTIFLLGKVAKEKT